MFEESLSNIDDESSQVASHTSNDLGINFGKLPIKQYTNSKLNESDKSSKIKNNHQTNQNLKRIPSDSQVKQTFKSNELKKLTKKL